MPELLKSVLIANRGEIALRIIRACKELGIRSILAHSEADADSLPVTLADEAVCIGPALARFSYRDPRALIGAALAFKADAIHPGYGFLSENAEFAEMCEEEGIVFVGPAGDVIRKMGDKIEAKRIARAAGVPTVPGSLGAISDQAEALAVAREVGFPLLIKAAAGGGGRGMRVVRSIETLEKDLAEIMSEAELAFGDAAVYIERYLTDIRHIEMQVISDGEATLHLGERDCTAQRRNQKLIEEAPSPVLDSRLRKALAEAAVSSAKPSATRMPTVEFVFDNTERKFYYRDEHPHRNEHPVTEMVTGSTSQAAAANCESRRWGLRNGCPISGHAMSAASTPKTPRGICPSPDGPELPRPRWRRGQNGYPHRQDYTIPPLRLHVGKPICWGKDREEAIARMKQASTSLSSRASRPPPSSTRRSWAAPSLYPAPSTLRRPPAGGRPAITGK